MAEQWEYAFVDMAISSREDTTKEFGVRQDATLYLNDAEVRRKDITTIGTTPFLLEYFQELGSQGWELVLIDESETYFFKRRKP